MNRNLTLIRTCHRHPIDMVEAAMLSATSESVQLTVIGHESEILSTVDRKHTVPLVQITMK